MPPPPTCRTTSLCHRSFANPVAACASLQLTFNSSHLTYPLQSPVRCVTPAYLSDRIPTVTREQSERVVEGLKQIGLLGDDGYLLADPHEHDVSLVL